MKAIQLLKEAAEDIAIKCKSNVRFEDEEKSDIILIVAEILKLMANNVSDILEDAKSMTKIRFVRKYHHIFDGGIAEAVKYWKNRNK